MGFPTELLSAASRQTGPRDLAPILPRVDYDQGYLIEGKTRPYYSFCQPDESARWSDDMTEFISEASKTHFIDRYNRALAIEAIAPALARPGAAYIDMGCSSGYMLEDALAAFPHANIFGSDYFASGLIQCHHMLPDVPLLQMDITNSPLPNDSFDAISCLNVLEHIPDDVKALGELLRLLKPGGRLVITVPMGPHLYDMTDEVHFHVRRYRRQELKQKFIDAGFQIIHMNFFGVWLYPAFYARKKLNQILYKKLTLKMKHQHALQQTRQSGRIAWMEKLCQGEKWLGQYIRYPFGIRSCVVATKSDYAPNFADKK